MILRLLKHTLSISTLPLAAAVAVACGAKPPAVDTQVRKIRFEDNGPWLSARSDAALREAMAHEKPRGMWPLRDHATLDRTVLENDRHRLAVHYAHQGFFDARVLRWEEKVVREATDERPPVVVLTGHIEPGDPSEITEVTVSGTAGLSAPARAVVEKQLMQLEGARPQLEAHDSALAQTERALGNLAFAQAEVEGTLTVDRDAREVSASYEVRPGPTATFGAIDIEGGERVPDGLLRHRIRFEPGDPFHLDSLDATRNRLYGLGVFSTAKVQPQLGQGGTVPVRIELDRRKPRSLTAGAGLELAAGRQEALLRLGAEHINIAQQLVSARLSVTGGYAVLAASLADLEDGLDRLRSGPTVDAEAVVAVPVVAGWRSELEAEYVRGITEAFVTDQPAGTLSVAGQLADDWSLALAYRVRFTRYRDVQVDPRQLAALEGAPDLVDGSYVDAHLEQTLVWDARNDALAPSRGWRHSVTLREAGRGLGGDYNYLGTEVDLRGYASLGRGLGDRRLVLAGRLGGGYLLPFGADDARAVPVAERLYLGGSGSVRGWIYQHLGPYICSLESDADCSSQPGSIAPDGVDTVPVGGRVSSYGSLELRGDGETFGGALFTDVGMVWATPEQIRQVPVLPSVGVGGRLATPVGPLRADVAVRTDNQPMFRQEPRVWLHIGIGEAF